MDSDFWLSVVNVIAGAYLGLSCYMVWILRRRVKDAQRLGEVNALVLEQVQCEVERLELALGEKPECITDPNYLRPAMRRNFH